MKLAALLTNLFKKSAVDLTQKELADLLAIDAEVPDAVATQVEKSLMNAEAARVHPDVHKVIRGEVLNGIDAKVNEVLQELGVEATEDITGEKNSYERIAKLARTIKTVEAKKASSGGGKEKEAYEKQIQELAAQLKAAKESLAAKEKEFSEIREGDLTNFELHKKLLGKEYALPKEMDSDIVLSTAQTAINKALATKGYKIARDKESGALKILNKEGIPALSEQNEPLEINQFIDGALAQNKLLKVNDQNPEGGGNTQHVVIPGAGDQKGNPAIVNEINSQMFT